MHPRLQDIVTNIRERNTPPIPATRVKGFTDLAATNAWLFANPSMVDGGVHFSVASPADIRFTLQGNHSVKFFRGKFQDPTYFVDAPLQVATQREIAR